MADFEHPIWTPLLSNPAITTVFLTGCGGGFDFVHATMLIPQLKRAGKKIVIGSYSFGDPSRIIGGDVVFEVGNAVVKRVDATCQPCREYGPEVGICAFLDAEYPADAPHHVYAYNARVFTVPVLIAAFEELWDAHGVQAVVSTDGGSDSLMAGDESGLGDPIEDATTIAAIDAVVASRRCLVDSPAAEKPATQILAHLLIVVGVGCDRFNGVSDCATLRAVAELTALGGFHGCVSMTCKESAFYDKCVTFLQQQAFFRSVIANSIVESSRGAYGADVVPASLRRRVQPGELFLWPLMSVLFVFDVRTVRQRSLLAPRLMSCQRVQDAYAALHQMREDLHAQGKLRAVEQFPSTNNGW